MNQIKVEQISDGEKKKLGIPSSAAASGGWSVWECEPSTFDWQYSDTEIAYVYEGRVKVKTPTEEVSFGKNQLVTFPKGLKCTWEVLENIRKVYKFQR